MKGTSSGWMTRKAIFGPGASSIHLGMRDQEVLFHQAIEEARLVQQPVVVRIDLIDLAVERAVPAEEESAGVPKTGGERLHSSSSWSMGLPVTAALILCQNSLMTTPTPTTAAMIPWIRKLPVPGSM